MKIIIEKNLEIPMRDGCVLKADLFRSDTLEKLPILLNRTPYDKSMPVAMMTLDTIRAASAGYNVLFQDCRGQFASAGAFTCFQHEARDGYDTIEWAARQPWSDGIVGTFGLSYPGAVQWLAAVENPPHLKAMVPAMTFSTPRNFFYSGGVFDGSWLDWIWFNIAPDARRRKNLPGPQTHNEAAAAWKQDHERLQNFLPLRDLPDLKQVAPFYYEWLSHAPADTWWDWAELRNKYDRVHAAVLNFSGWYDEAYGPDGATTNFNGLLAARRGEKDPRTHTMIGPWTHGGQDESKSGERDFGPTAPIDYDELILRWMDHYLRNIDNGADREKPVRLFVMGDNAWRDEDFWPLTRAKETFYYLNAEAAKARIGTLNSALLAPSARSSEIVSDPAHPLTDPYTEYGAHGYRAFAGRDDVLVFDTPALETDTEVTGPIRAEIFVSADVPDFDLWVRLLDVSPDGTAFNLMSPGLDVLRASYRDASLKPELLTPGKVYLLNLDRMLTSNVFRAGHRIRIQISAAFSPHFSRNPQTGESEITSSQTQLGHIRIYHDAEHSSRIVLPIIPRAKQ